MTSLLLRLLPCFSKYLRYLCSVAILAFSADLIILKFLTRLRFFSSSLTREASCSESMRRMVRWSSRSLMETSIWSTHWSILIINNNKACMYVLMK